MRCTDEHIDALREIVNVGVGSAASILNSMLNAHVRLEVPVLRIVTLDELMRDMESERGTQTLAAVSMAFKGDISGVAEVVLPSGSAARFVAALAQDDSGDSDLDAIQAGTLSEVGNIILNSVVGSVSNTLEFSLTYALPNYLEGGIGDVMPRDDVTTKSAIVIAHTRLGIEQLAIVGDIVMFIDRQSFDSLLTAIDSCHARI